MRIAIERIVDFNRDEVSVNVKVNTIMLPEGLFTMIDAIEVLPLVIDKAPLVMKTLDTLHYSRVKVTKGINLVQKMRVRQPEMLCEVSEWGLIASHHSEVSDEDGDRMSTNMKGAKIVEIEIVSHQ